MTTRDTVPVSVIIPCYRACKTIERALASVNAQTAWPLEIILIDDGSDDGTLELLEALKDAHPQPPIRVLSNQYNQGAAMARNKGWNLALGDYIAFLDADDAWLPDKLYIQYRFMSANPDITASGHYYSIGHSSQRNARLPCDTLHSRIISRLEIVLHNPCVTPSIMLRRDISLRFSDSKRYMEDHLLWQEIVFSGHKFAQLNRTLAVIFKPLYGASGLSSHLWKMQRSELDNYSTLRKIGHYSLPTQLFLQSYSWVKFLKRALIVTTRRLQGRKQ